MLPGRNGVEMGPRNLVTRFGVIQQVNSSPPLQHFFEGVAVLPGRKDAEMGPEISLHASA